MELEPESIPHDSRMEHMAPSPFHENDPYIVCSGGCVSNEIILVISIPGHILRYQPLKHIPAWEGLVQ